MDLTATKESLDNNQENNQLLLNAIKNKFAASPGEASSFSPPKFTIPTLKIGGNANHASSAPTNINGTTNQLNQFLLKQLQETSHSKPKDTTETAATKCFVLPNLNVRDNESLGTKTFEIPLLKTTANRTNNNVSTLTTAINNLQVNESNTLTPHPADIPATITPAIDLTSALSLKSSHHQGTPPTRDFHIKQKQPVTVDLDFDIPFIDCDRLDTSAKLLAKSNEYCQIDISQESLRPNCVQPSAVGQFLCLADKRYIVPVKCWTSPYKKKVKHEIKPFYFDTKSPDDIVLASLNKYQRRHFN